MKHTVAPIITAIFLCASLLLWGQIDRQHARATARQASISMAESLLGALTGSLQSSLRRGYGNRERIQTILETTIQNTHLQHILVQQNELQIAQAGSLNPTLTP